MTLRLPQAEKQKFRHWLDNEGKKNKAECQRLLVRTLHNITRRAQRFAPVDKSYLKSSIRPIIGKDQLGGIVYVWRDYGPYQEFGTGSKVVAPADVADYAMTFKGKGIRKHNMRAQPYLFPAVRISQKEMIAQLEKMGFKKV